MGPSNGEAQSAAKDMIPWRNIAAELCQTGDNEGNCFSRNSSVLVLSGALKLVGVVQKNLIRLFQSALFPS